MHSDVGPLGAHANLGHQKDEIVEDQSPYARKDATTLSPEAVKFAAMCGLSAAATKAKLFADQEEREVQRIAATIINHQVDEKHRNTEEEEERRRRRRRRRRGCDCLLLQDSLNYNIVIKLSILQH